MSHLGELDDRLDDLRSECNKNTDTIRRLQDEIHRLKGESNGLKQMKGSERPEIGSRTLEREHAELEDGNSITGIADLKGAFRSYRRLE